MSAGQSVIERRADGQLIEHVNYHNPDGTSGTATVITLEALVVSVDRDYLDRVIIHAVGDTDDHYEISGTVLDQIVSREKLARYLDQLETRPCLTCLS